MKIAKWELKGPDNKSVKEYVLITWEDGSTNMVDHETPTGADFLKRWGINV